MAKLRGTTLEQRVAIVKEAMSTRKRKVIATKYGLSTQQLYRWIKKYEQFGLEGLEDRRGKKKVPETD